jgi:outer membrane protein assembly factor BamE (lipoprotein component of BamABCDE complex)
MKKGVLIITTALVLAGCIANEPRKYAEQEARIAKLEALLADKSSSPKKEIASNPEYSKLASANASGWKNKNNWDKIKNGMSYGQVKKILGKPTRSTKDMFFATYYYDGKTLQSEHITGRVSFNEGQVYLLTEPVF